jgi:hypothetical protein
MSSTPDFSRTLVPEKSIRCLFISVESVWIEEKRRELQERLKRLQSESAVEE